MNNKIIVFRHMRQFAIRTVFYAVFAAVRKFAAAIVAERVKRAKAEQAIEFAYIPCIMAREAFAIAV